jgi:4a-hydroxytetrahydrobiopterin dehydratase
MTIFTSNEILEKLNRIEGWNLKDTHIQRIYKFKDFKQALGFILQVGILAELADHHPEIINVYNNVTLNLNTHSANGITQKDIDLAKEINTISI